MLENKLSSFDGQLKEIVNIMKYKEGKETPVAEAAVKILHPLLTASIVDNHVPLKKSFIKKAGELVLVCESSEKRDESKSLVQSVKEEIKMNSPKIKKKSITIVGLSHEYRGEEI